MELYTSLTRLKMAMNGGVMPPMTTLSEQAKKLIDPAFTIGMGALEEHPEKGLRCPIRGCGVYRHRLSKHVSMSHRAVGGVVALRVALGLPTTAKLVSSAESERMRIRQLSNPYWSRGLTKTGVARTGQGQRRYKTLVENAASVGKLNLRDRCEAQIRHKLVDLHTRLGRSPSQDEAAAVYGKKFILHLRRTYGSWLNAKHQFGLERVSSGIHSKLSLDGALEGLKTWHSVHGELPSNTDARRRDRAPLIACEPAILGALNCHGWDEAMRRAASMLNIYGGRYGLPESARPKKAS